MPDKGWGALAHPDEKAYYESILLLAVRRLVIEANASEFARLTEDESVEKIKSLEVLHFIKQDPEEIVLICNVEFRDSSTKLDDIFNEPGSELQVLDQTKEGKYTVLFRSKPWIGPRTKELWAAGGYLQTPLEIKGGKVMMTFLGNTRQIGVGLSVLKSTGIHYTVLQLTDANFPHRSPLNRLTEKQRKVLTTAYSCGYYDLPRKISSKELGAKLKIGSSDLIKHRRKAERRVLAEVMSAAGRD